MSEGDHDRLFGQSSGSALDWIAFVHNIDFAAREDTKLRLVFASGHVESLTYPDAAGAIEAFDLIVSMRGHKWKRTR